MSEPRYRPRDYCLDWHGFGKALHVRWRPLTGAEASRIAAARMQHLWAVRIRERARAERIPLKMYAERVGTSYDRLLKLLRGDLIMRLEDVGMAELVLGDVVDAVSPFRPMRDGVPAGRG
ncbi:hypothetical protein [Cryobacterium sp. BB307]|uniref:hypothetical protein n=1 Tax=Cryobacterium sp. BB307 TaxID=2716317 RepID=UPI001444E94D|nr:hypothetical protein [Cryobacterium sp. BB307]